MLFELIFQPPKFLEDVTKEKEKVWDQGDQMSL
jgi:hypothetical protein